MVNTPLIPYVDLAADPAPKAQRYGLFTAATGPLDLPDRAIVGGLRWLDATTVLPAGFSVTCAANPVGFNDGCGSFITGAPFAVQATLDTGSVGMSLDEVNAILTARLVAGEQAVVERIFSDGTFGQANSLANNAVAATALTAAASVRRAIGQLDEYLASVTGTRGIIHAPAAVSSYFGTDSGVMKEGGKWVTPLGNIVSIGNYSGATPAGAAPAAGHTTMYACMNTVVYRTADIETPPIGGAFTPAENRYASVARRVYLVTHNNVFAYIDTTIA